MNRSPLAQRAQGRWRDILSSIGLDAKTLSGKHVPCPMCGGNDRFRWDNKDSRGTFICNGCGAGDGVELVKLFKRLDFKDAAELIEDRLGEARPEPARREPTEAENREARRSLWASGKAVQPDDAVGRYLSARVGLTAYPKALRTALRVRYPEGSTFYPVMLAAVQGPDGTAVSIHRTFLTEHGDKADVPQPRWLMPGKVPPGSAVRLAEPVDGVLGIAEGVETALSATALHGIPCWAAINSSRLKTWEPPAGVVEVFVFGDNDPKYGGQDAAYGLAHRLSVDRNRPGLRVRVDVPAWTGSDWNDELKRKQKEAA